MTQTVILAVDPGVSGALAVMVDGGLVGVQDMPTLTVQVGGKNRRIIDGFTLNAVIREAILNRCGMLDDPVVLVEEVGPMPRDGCVQAWTFSGAYHMLQGLAIGQNLPLRFVKPQVWKRDLKLRKGKDASRQRAMELWPAFRDQFAREKDDGRAEAALIGLWGHTQITQRGTL